MNPDQDDMEEIHSLVKNRKFDQTSVPDNTPLHAALFKGILACHSFGWVWLCVLDDHTAIQISTSFYSA